MLEFIERKMNTKGGITVLFLCFMTLFSLTDCNDCVNILEGKSLQFNLDDGKKLLQDNDRFTIRTDNKIIVPKRNRKQSGPGIVKGNYLELQHVNLSDSGRYTIEVFDVRGTNKISYTKEVCVYAKIPKPRVNITCMERNVDIRCEVETDRNQRSVISYSWHKNGKEFKKELPSFNFTSINDKSTYTCTVHNPVHNNTSDPVQATCFKPATLFRFLLWIVVVIFVAGLILILFVTITVGCVVRQKKEQERMMVHLLRSNSPPPNSPHLEQILNRPLPPLP